jgi:hypothetical protein
MQDSYKVEGPACKTRIVQGLFKENATATLWILDPTAADARVRGGPRRELGSRVHGGPSPRGYALSNLGRPQKIGWPGSRSCV